MSGNAYDNPVLDIPSSGICLITLSNNSDMQNSVYSMFSALTEHGYEAWTVGIKNPKCLNACYTHKNIYVECPDRPGVTKGTFNIKAAERVVQAVRSTGCKTIYFESVHLWNCYILLRLGPDYTRITTLHDVIPHDGSKSVLACQRLQCRLTDYVVVKSVEFVDDVELLYNFSHEKIIVLGVWRDWPPFQECTGDGSFLFFGRIRKYKGLQAMEQIAQSCPGERFSIVGSPDEGSRSVLARIGKLSNVALIDREISDGEMEAVFKTASWVLIPYESASQSGVIIEAYKFGRPVIAFNVGAIASQVEEGKTGFLAPAGEVNAFVSLIEDSSALSQEQYERSSRAAYEFGYEKYAAQSLCEELASAFFIKKNEDNAVTDN